MTSANPGRPPKAPPPNMGQRGAAFQHVGGPNSVDHGSTLAPPIRSAPAPRRCRDSGRTARPSSSGGGRGRAVGGDAVNGSQRCTLVRWGAWRCCARGLGVGPARCRGPGFRSHPTPLLLNPRPDSLRKREAAQPLGRASPGFPRGPCPGAGLHACPSLPCLYFSSRP